MSSHRLRLFSSMLVAFLLVSLYGRLSTGPLVTPAQAANVKNLLSKIKFNPNSLVKLFTINFSPGPNNSPSGNGVGSGAYVMPTVNQLPPQIQPTLLPNVTAVPTDTNQNCTGQACLTPTVYEPQPTTYQLQPTNYNLQPTKPPKPTSPPPLPPITSNTRPGTSLSEIFQDVSKRECIPAALLYAFQTEETGAWITPNEPSSFIKIYNTYGWWTDGSGNSCTGMGYDTATGIVPADAADAGTQCQNPVGGSDQQIMGIFQISSYEVNGIEKYTAPVIKGPVDRRVLYDAALIFSIITKNRLGTPPSDCNNWPDSAINTAAEKHYGSCGDNYCSNILKYYKQYNK